MMRLTTALVCATLALTACKQDQPAQPVQRADDPMPTLPEPEPRVTPEFADLAAEVGLGTTTDPGPLDGAWALQRRDGVEVAKIHLRHEAGDAQLLGVVKMADGALTKIAPTSRFRGEVLDAGWVLDYEGRNYRFGITDGQLLPDGRVQVRFAEQRDGSVIDAFLVRPKG